MGQWVRRRTPTLYFLGGSVFDRAVFNCRLLTLVVRVFKQGKGCVCVLSQA